MSWLFGGEGLDRFSLKFNAALQNQEVHSIVLDIDSPGGNISGVSEVSRMVRAARGQKDITAYASGDMCSAAYWIGSAADSIFASPTSKLGSIGVIASAVDDKERMKREGIEIHNVVSENAPKKNLKISTKEGKESLQSIVNAIEDVFIADVSNNRGVKRQTVISNYGQGGVIVGAAAVEAGLADGISSMEDVIDMLQLANGTGAMNSGMRSLA
jgi:signal peptide peptidase SppA